MSKKRWTYQKAEGHHHVIISKDEVLDVDTEEHARAIAKVPEMLALIKAVNEINLKKAFTLASQISKELEHGKD